jgi:hypothetical protein
MEQGGGLPVPYVLETPGAVVVRFVPSESEILGATGRTAGKAPVLVSGLLTPEPALTVAKLAARLDKSELMFYRSLKTRRESGRLQRIGLDKDGYCQVIK